MRENLMKVLKIHIFILILSAIPLNADDFFEDFSGSIIDENLALTATEGFTIRLVNGQAVAEKVYGIGNGSIRLETKFSVIGDFEASIEASRLDLSSIGEMGLVSTHNGLAEFTDIFYVGNSKIHANILVSPILTYQDKVNYSDSVIFRIRRVQNKVFLEFDSGTGFELLNSAEHENLSGPVKIQLFMLQEYGMVDYLSGTFDNFRITADEFTNGPVSSDRSSWGKIKNK
jgi:hypothetical protein